MSGVETVENCVITYIIISSQFPDSYRCGRVGRCVCKVNELHKMILE